jgi:hypothetical protein
MYCDTFFYFKSFDSPFSHLLTLSSLVGLFMSTIVIVIVEVVVCLFVLRGEGEEGMTQHALHVLSLPLSRPIQHTLHTVGQEVVGNTMPLLFLLLLLLLLLLVRLIDRDQPDHCHEYYYYL